MLPADDEGGHTGHAGFARMGVAVAQFLAVGVTGQQFFNHRSIHADVLCDVRQCVCVPDILPLLEIGSKQGVHRCILQAFKPRPMDQAMGINRVWRGLDRVKCDAQPHGLARSTIGP